jgi:peroxiredoxin Q/BCP
VGRLVTGDKVPNFSLPNERGRLISSKDLFGKRHIIYFYPADDTPGCTTEACQFTDLIGGFKKLRVPIYGVSPDDGPTHLAFIKKYSLGFSLLSDPSHSTMEKFGAYGEKTLYGKKMLGVIRSTFVIDAMGKIERVWYNVRADGHAKKVIEFLEQ